MSLIYKHYKYETCNKIISSYYSYIKFNENHIDNMEVHNIYRYAICIDDLNNTLINKKNNQELTKT